MIHLILLWSFGTGWMVSSLAGDGLLGVASFANCFYLLHWNGTLALKYCPGTRTLSVSVTETNGTYAFLTDRGVYLIHSKNVNFVKCNCTASLPTDRGLIACTKDGTLLGPGWRTRLACNWLTLWGSRLVAVSNNSTFVIDIRTGKVLKVFEIGGHFAATCNNFLAISSNNAVYLFRDHRIVAKFTNLTYPAELAFSDHCKFLALTDAYRGRLIILNVTDGKVVFTKTFTFFAERCPVSLFAVAWKGDKLVVGRGDGWVEAYEVKGLG